MDEDTVDFSNVSAENICFLIDDILSGINQKITSATQFLKVYTEHKQSIRNLIFILMQATNSSYRQMATILLKRNLVKLYSEFEPHEQVEFRNLLLNQYVKESMIAIQRGIAMLIGMLLPIVQLKNWPELQQLLDQAVQSASDSVATFVLLNHLLYHFKPPKQIYPYLFNALESPHLVEEVMKCILSVAETQDVDQSLAVELIKKWEKCNWPEDICLLCLQTLSLLCEKRVKMHDDIIYWICDHLISNKKHSKKFRTAGLDILLAYIQFSGKTLSSKQKLLKKVVDKVCSACSEPFGMEEDESQTVQQISLWVIETLAISLKQKKIYPVLFEAATTLLRSQDVNQIKTGFLAFGSMSEGCSERLKKNLQNPMMNVFIPKGLAHESAEVREAAIHALGYFSEFLVPEIVNFHATVIPAMMKSFSDLSPKVTEKALIATDIFFDNMEEEDINSYLPVVIPELIKVLMSNNSNPIMRNAAMSAIGSAVEAANMAFLPYLQNMYKICCDLLKLQPSPEINIVRGQNISLLGKLASIFCSKKHNNHVAFYQNCIVPLMEGIYSILIHEGEPEIRESCFQFFYLVAAAIQQEFDPIFDKIIPQVLKTATMKIQKQKQESKNQFKDEFKKEFSPDSDKEGEGVIQGGEYDEKAAAIHALGQFANACPIKFIPYFEQAYKILDENHKFFSLTIRTQVPHCYFNLTKGLIKSKNGGVLPDHIPGTPCLQRYPEELENYFQTEIIPRLLFMMTDDESSRASSTAIEAFNDLIKAIGPVFIDKSLESITETLINMFCRQLYQNEDEEDDDEEQDTDKLIFEPLCDLIPTICQKLQGGFEPSLNKLSLYFMTFIEERQEINDNVVMTGCLSQVFESVPGFTQSHGSEYFNQMLELIKQEDADLNCNISFCFGQMFEKAPQTMAPHLQDGLIALRGIYENQHSDQACKDNALAALCRIICTFNPPMPYEVFLKSLIQSMPFKGDEEEESTALKCIIHLSQKDHGLIKPHIPALLSILENDLSNSKKYQIQGNFQQEVINYYNALKNYAQ